MKNVVLLLFGLILFLPSVRCQAYIEPTDTTFVMLLPVDLGATDTVNLVYSFFSGDELMSRDTISIVDTNAVTVRIPLLYNRIVCKVKYFGTSYSMYDGALLDFTYQVTIYRRE